MRIIIFSDSLARPRPDISVSEKTEYEEVYGYLLKNYFVDDEVEIIYIESLDTNDAIFWSERMVAFRRPDIVLFHIGINDCSPRIFKKNSKSLFLKPIFRKLTFNLVMRFIGKYRRFLIKYIFKNKVYTDIDTFKSNIDLIISKIREFSPSCFFVGIGISERTSYLEGRSPGGNDNVRKYNFILKNIFKDNYIETNEVLGGNPDNFLISDGIHFTKNSHYKMFMVLKTRIEKYKKIARS